jgi:hypothetical protein
VCQFSLFFGLFTHPRDQLTLCNALLRGLASAAGPAPRLFRQLHLLVDHMLNKLCPERVRSRKGGWADNDEQEREREAYLAAEPRAGPADLAAFCEALAAALDTLPQYEPWVLNKWEPFNGHYVPHGQRKFMRIERSPKEAAEYYFLAEVRGDQKISERCVDSDTCTTTYG